MAGSQPDPYFDDLYRDLILDHYRLPRNNRVLDAPDADLTQFNPVCGDEIRLTARIRNGAIEEIAFVGQGCSISQSSASMMTEAMRGRSIEDAHALAHNFRAMILGEDVDEMAMGDLMSLQGTSRYPTRVKCAVLAWDTLQKALGGASGREDVGSSDPDSAG
ncbi:MAG: SUF system NifU family Fe-S cluster assembly protein [Dehalococcoidia bacterium]|nr:SUF system NifU family Fe-S cluster assembly protein [Dehalococcoidia bacterium]